MIDRAMLHIRVRIPLVQVEEKLLLGHVKQVLYLREWGEDYPYLTRGSCPRPSCLPVSADSPGRALISPAAPVVNEASYKMNRLR